MLSRLQRKCVDLTYKLGVNHLSSVLTCVDEIDRIYSVKKPNEPFILSNGHAFLALAVVLQEREGKNAEKLCRKHGTHPNRDKKDGIWCSTGSLGQGLPIAVGMALADRSRNVYVMTSDGEMAEGSCWEALRIASDARLENLRVICIANGYSAYKGVDSDLLDTRMQMFYPSLVIKKDLYDLPDFMQSWDGHYVKLTKEQYEAIK